MLVQGMNHGKACVLIALDEMFDGDYEGRDFIIDLFVEQYTETGFMSKDMYLLEESAPVFVLPSGKWTMHYVQGDDYLQIYSRRGDNVRYRVRPSRKLIYMYEDHDNISHAICIHASSLVALIGRTVYSGLILPTQGLIVDYKEWTE